MSLKLKVLGLGLVAAMAMGALAVVNASANVSGHFTSDSTSTTIKGLEGSKTPHALKFQRTAPTGTFTGKPIECTEANYTGTVSGNTVETIQVFPQYTGCATEGDDHNNPDLDVIVDTNGCSYTFRSRTTGHATVAVDCPQGKAIVVTHPNCEITIPAQDPATSSFMKGGAIYTTTTNNAGKHDLTVDVTITHITGHFHGGACIFLGTVKEFDMNGAVAVQGFDATGAPTNITAT